MKQPVCEDEVSKLYMRHRPVINNHCQWLWHSSCVNWPWI